MTATKKNRVTESYLKMREATRYFQNLKSFETDCPYCNCVIAKIEDMEYRVVTITKNGKDEKIALCKECYAKHTNQ